MSKQSGIQVSCGNCQAAFNAQLWRIVWTETPGLRAMIFDDTLNVLRCPRCGVTSRPPLALLFVDQNRGFAVWYEPEHDSMIDDEIPQYARQFGANCYYVTAPRIPEWQRFKETILKFERGELKAEPLDRSKMVAALMGTAQKRKSARGGCLPVLVLAAAVIAVAGALAFR